MKKIFLDKNKILRDHILSLTDGKDYGLCAPPMSADVAIDELCRHFLGDNWYITMSVSPSQANTEIVYAIEQAYPGDKKARKKLYKKYILTHKLKKL